MKNCTQEPCYSHTIDKTPSNICLYPSKFCDNNTLCISVDMLCNGQKDCLDGSDEGGQCGKLAVLHCLNI